MRTTLATRVASAALAGGVAVTGLAVLPTVAVAAPGAPSAAAAVAAAPLAPPRPPPGCKNPTPYRKNPNCRATVTQSSNSVRQGSEFKLSFTKLRPGSTVRVTVAGVVKTVKADRNGRASLVVSLPADAKAGRTKISINGTNGDGSKLSTTRGLTITQPRSGPGSDVRGVSLNRDGTAVTGTTTTSSGASVADSGVLGETVTAPQRGLVFTGAEIGTAVGLGLLLLGGGATLVLVSRRRKAPAA